jgi:hypothetical protein
VYGREDKLALSFLMQEMGKDGGMGGAKIAT